MTCCPSRDSRKSRNSLAAFGDRAARATNATRERTTVKSDGSTQATIPCSTVPQGSRSVRPRAPASLPGLVPTRARGTVPDALPAALHQLHERGQQDQADAGRHDHGQGLASRPDLVDLVPSGAVPRGHAAVTRAVPAGSVVARRGTVLGVAECGHGPRPVVLQHLTTVG